MNCPLLGSWRDENNEAAEPRHTMMTMMLAMRMGPEMGMMFMHVHQGKAADNGTGRVNLNSAVWPKCKNANFDIDAGGVSEWVSELDEWMIAVSIDIDRGKIRAKDARLV